MSDPDDVHGITRDYVLLAEVRQLSRKVDELALNLSVVSQRDQKVAEHILEIVERARRDRVRLRRIEKKLGTRTIAQDEESAVHDLREIQGLRKTVETIQRDRRDSEMWWKRKRWSIFFAALGGSLLFLAGILATLLESKMMGH